MIFYSFSNLFFATSRIRNVFSADVYTRFKKDGIRTKAHRIASFRDYYFLYSGLIEILNAFFVEKKKKRRKKKENSLLNFIFFEKNFIAKLIFQIIYFLSTILVVSNISTLSFPFNPILSIGQKWKLYATPSPPPSICKSTAFGIQDCPQGVNRCRWTGVHAVYTSVTPCWRRCNIEG